MRPITFYRHLDDLSRDLETSTNAMLLCQVPWFGITIMCRDEKIEHDLNFR
jgi:hypothetical protein